MAAVVSACPLEFMSEGISAMCFDTPPPPLLRRATTEPPPDSILLSPQTKPLDNDEHQDKPKSRHKPQENPEAPGRNPETPPPPPIDGPSVWAMCEKNTFLSLEAPIQPSLLRSKTDPMSVYDLESVSDSNINAYDVVGMPPPPPLGLEFFATADNFESMSMTGEACDELSRPPGLPAPPPPPLPLEFIETDDPFRRTPAAEKFCLLDFPAPPPLSLEFVATDDPFRPTPTGGYSLGPLSLEYLSTDDSLHSMPNSLDLSAPPGLPLAPPPLTLESFDTEDPFDNPVPLIPTMLQMTTPEPAFVPLPQRPAMCGPPPPPMIPAPVMIGIAKMPPPPPPPAMPSQPAPEFEAPSAHDVPMTQPGHMPGAGITALLSSDLRQPGLLARPMTVAGCTHVHWGVDSRKLESQDKQTVSPVFQVELPGHGLTPFKLVLYPKATNDGKHGAGFKKAKGHGKVVLKCEAQLPESQSDVCFRVGVGRAGKGSETLQPFRGPAMENFFEHSCHGLAKQEEDWDFSASVEDSRTFVVTVEIAPTAAFGADPSIWWVGLPEAPAESTTPDVESEC